MQYRRHFLPGIFVILLPLLLYSGDKQRTFHLFKQNTSPVSVIECLAHEIERNYVTLNPELAEPGTLGVGSEIGVEINGVYREFSVLGMRSYTEGTYSVIAKGGISGKSRLLFTLSGERIAGSFYDSDLSVYYQISYDNDKESAYIAQVDPLKLDHLPCSAGADEINIMRAVSTEHEAGSPPGYFPPNMSALASTLADPVTIDLMIVYTEAAEEWAIGTDFGSMDMVIAQALNMSQVALDNSDVFFELRPVHIHKTDYDETEFETQVGLHHLMRLTASEDHNPFGEEFAGYMEEVHELRDRYGADLVALMLSEPGTGGTAWMMTNPRGDPRYGFSINRVQQMGNSYTLVHEIGHNLGNNHARGQNQAPAGLVGGIFEYSTAYRWIGSTGGFSTVMGYTEIIYQIIPHFSNPDLTWEEYPTGVYFEPRGPSDNARSMREIKGVVANYRTTVVDPPYISVSENSINISAGDDGTHIVPVTITNLGNSDLMWRIDFEMQNPAAPERRRGLQEAPVQKAIALTEELPVAVGVNAGGAIFKVTDTENTELLSTGFFAEDGFSTGNFSATRLWRTWTDDMHFEISDENPSIGDMHMRISRQESIEMAKRVDSPYFGPQPFGAFEFSADLSFENMVRGEGYESFQLDIIDASADITASILFANGYIYIRQYFEPLNTITWVTAFDSYSLDGYFNIKIITDPDERLIHYYYNDEYLRSTEYLTGKTFDFFYFVYNNSMPDTYIDIDNIQVRRLYDPFKWMSLDRYGGTVVQGGSSSFNLTFSSTGMEHGEYTADLIIRSNDPDRPEYRMPVTLNISTLRADDRGDEIPGEFVLYQNYPNPFNPGTVIQFRVPKSGRVRLEVYDITGRLVDVLLDDEIPSGDHQVTYNVSGLSSGVYIYRLFSGSGVLNRKMIIAK